MSRLGDTIRAARLKAGMTPKALGKKCGVAESFINDVEMGRKIVSDDQAQRILKVLGVKNPVSTELEVAAEPAVELRPRPRPYVMPVQTEPEKKPTKEEIQETQAATDAWLDALGGVVKRVPILGSDGVVIDHRLLPVIGGKIEGGHPDKVVYFRQEDDSMRGFRVYAGDLLLTIPCPTPVAISMASLLKSTKTSEQATEAHPISVQSSIRPRTPREMPHIHRSSCHTEYLSFFFFSNIFIGMKK